MPWLALTIGLATAAFVTSAYEKRWRWTGLTRTAGCARGQHTKTLWDRLQLLIIPLALAVLAYQLNSAQAKRERTAVLDSAREDVLDGYYQQMSTAAAERQLLRSERESDVGTVARITTLSAVRRLNGARRGQVLRFLHEAQLVQKASSVDVTRAAFRGAELTGSVLDSADLDDIDLSHADLRHASLVDATLNDAVLADADLRHALMNPASLFGARMSGADLRSAFLEDADLRRADLRDADLRDADLRGADLRGANLLAADLRGADLRGAKRGGVRSADLRGARVK